EKLNNVSNFMGSHQKGTTLFFLNQQYKSALADANSKVCAKTIRLVEIKIQASKSKSPLPIHLNL
ncbi:hypothetical protein, partial [Fructilactobacillus sanfranciscensis]|uniref:hypothetical protein n=1 Tax=Fructilactobacillus sanfranciscensis TaxID=1625 RepID=UPI0031F9858A